MRIGALMRAYARTPDEVGTVVSGVIKATQKLFCCADIAEIHIGVWADRHNPAADCGKTYRAMCCEFANHPRVHVYEMMVGDLFVDILNAGVVEQSGCNVTHSLIMSWKAADYVDETLVAKMKRVVFKGALVVGVTLPEVKEFVCKGAVMNTCALWNINELLSVGGFDERDSKPRSVDNHKESNAGVGEFLPALKLAEKHRRRILAVVSPSIWAEMSVPVSRHELQRQKMDSKHRRIDGMLKENAKTWGDLRAMVMSYPLD